MKRANKSNGITLIALVITIIVLLILAGITMNAVIGDNGIIQKAKRVSDDTKEAQTKETIRSEELGKYIESYTLNIKYGDANLDGIIDRTDLTGIENCITYLARETVEGITEDNIDKIKSNADLNLDEEITRDDEIILALYLEYPGEIQLPYLEELPLFGDANLDGNVDEEDADLISKYEAELADLNLEMKRNAHCYLNGNSEVFIKDITAIRKYIAGLTDHLPVIVINNEGEE